MEENSVLLRRVAAQKRLIALIALCKEIWAILGVAVLLLVILEVSLTSYYGRAHQKETQSAVEAAVNSGVYVNASFAEAYFKELIAAARWPWAPYTQSHEAEYAGKYINVTEGGTRRTWNSAKVSDTGKARLTIFFFGASTLWGFGARDDFTIPSLVSKQLAENGFSANVVNDAVIADVTTQSLIRLVFELRKHNAPDLVVFYGGLVDAVSACSQGKAGVPLGNSNLERVSSDLEKIASKEEEKARISIRSENLALMRLLSGKKQVIGCSNKLDRLSDAAVDVYLGNVRVIEALSRSFSFNTLFYLEPQLPDKTHRTKYEESQLLAFEEKLPGAYDLYALTRKKLADREYEALGRHAVHDLRDIFSDITAPIYVYEGHYGENGNERIAGKIAADIFALYAPAK